jgi:small GTP-binding protein
MTSHISIKFLVIGDEKVGKTTIINYFTLVPIKATSTVGIDFQTRIVALSAENKNEDQSQGKDRCQQVNTNKKYGDKNYGDKNYGDNRADSETMLLSTMKVGSGSVVRPNDYDYVKCCFWDTSGSPNYQCLAQTYYTGIAAVIVVFDLSRQSSYNNINSYITRIIQKNTCNHSHPILVLGNKLDQRSIHFTKKQVFEALCFDFPHENIRYEEVSCIDKLNTLEYGCAGCAHSSDVHFVLNSFIQSLYDSIVKPHYYNPQAIAAINCRGITGNSRFFKEKINSDSVSSKRWNWKGNYTNYIRDSKDTVSKNSGSSRSGSSSSKSGSSRSGSDYIQMANLKTPRECCNEQGLERVSSCTSGCSIM